jgi:hypothetical protein
MAFSRSVFNAAYYKDIGPIYYVQVCPLMRIEKHVNVTSQLGSTPILKPMVATILPKPYNAWFNISD